METGEDQHQDQASQLSVPTPEVKFEISPTESFLSTPGELYPSLFAVTPASASTMDPMERALTPESSAADDNTVAAPSPAPTASAEGEKKPAKKRKSWGQVLPEPKTNLPPRKRAKTEDEKEQRRVERVLRNRRAAQSSRERKRQEVEALEQRNADLESALHTQQKQNLALMEELAKLRRSAGVVSRSPSPLDVFQPSPLTLSQPLFDQSADAADAAAQAHSGIMDDFILMPEQDGTVDPASISPELSPMADTEFKPSAAIPNPKTETTAAPTAAAASSDVTQHPAAVLCDLQCPSVGAPPVVAGAQTNPVPATPNVVDGLFGADFGLLPSTDIDHWGSQGQLSPSTDPLNFEYNHLAGDAAPELPEFDINQFLSDDDVSGATSGATAAHDPISQEPDSTFSFFDFENQVPTETFNLQPILARPLMDATMEFLRLVSEGRDDWVDGLATGSPGIKGDQGRGPLLWPEGTSLPSREVLLTLLWAIRVEERKLIVARERQRSSSPLPSSRPGSSVLREETPTNTNKTIVLSTAAKRKGDGKVNGRGKRIRLGL